jgi:hypothetical protein
MTEHEKTIRLDEFITAFKRRLRIDAIDAGNKVHFLRLTYMEGKRITQIGLVKKEARHLAHLFSRWADDVDNE